MQLMRHDSSSVTANHNAWEMYICKCIMSLINPLILGIKTLNMYNTYRRRLSEYWVTYTQCRLMRLFCPDEKKSIGPWHETINTQMCKCLSYNHTTPFTYIQRDIDGWRRLLMHTVLHKRTYARTQNRPRKKQEGKPQTRRKSPAIIQGGVIGTN